MRIDIQSIHFDADQKLIDHITNKMNKVEKYFDGIVAVNVFLRLDKSETKDNKIVEVRLEVPGPDLFATKRSNTFEEATDLATDALIRQVKKTKDKLRHR